jgi:hypothetical protein
MIPAGTFVKGVVDSSKRAGRIKGKAELQFHLTSLIYPNRYTLDIAAAVDQVPGSADTHMREPGKIERCEERFFRGEGTGTYTFVPNSECMAELKRLGYTAPDDEQVLSMLLTGVNSNLRAASRNPACAPRRGS